MPKTTKEYVREIRKINARFRKMKKRDGPMADRLMRRKDMYIDLMQEACTHPRAFETAGSPSNGPFGLGGTPMRICEECGFAEQPTVPDGYKALILMPVAVTHDAYLIEQGKILKKLGINI